MLRTGCIKTFRQPEDGLRISVMSRHTLTDGVTPDPEISKELFDEHWVVLAPPSALVGAYYKRGLPWKQFAFEYRSYLQRGEAQQAIGRMIELAHIQSVTLLCIEKTPECCHRRLLAEACMVLDPGLQVLIR